MSWRPPVGGLNTQRLYDKAVERGVVVSEEGLSPPEIVALFGVSKERVHALIKRGRLLARRVAKNRWRVLTDEEGRPIVSLMSHGDKPPWADKVRVVEVVENHIGVKPAPISETLSELERRLENL